MPRLAPVRAQIASGVRGVVPSSAVHATGNVVSASIGHGCVAVVVEGYRISAPINGIEARTVVEVGMRII